MGSRWACPLGPRDSSPLWRGAWLKEGGSEQGPEMGALEQGSLLPGFKGGTENMVSVQEL